MRKNENRLVPGPIVYWGDIVGNITDQPDLITYVNEHGGGGGSEAVWGSITGNIADQSDLTDYVSTALSGYATESWVENQGYLTEHQDLSSYATMSWVENQGYITSSALSGYATESWVGEQGYITSSALSGYATESWVGEQGYITSSALSGYATESWVGDQGYLNSESELVQPLNDQEVFIDGLTGGFVVDDPGKNTTYGGRYIFNIGGEIYYYATSHSSKIWKFNKDTFKFDLIGDTGILLESDYPVWGDDNGNVFIGNKYSLDLTRLKIYARDMGGDYLYNQGRHNIIRIDGQLYMVTQNSAYKYDENNRHFYYYEPIAVSGITNANFYRYGNYFSDGQFAYTITENGVNVLYKFVHTLEPEETITAVTADFFPTSYNSTSVGADRTHYINGEYVWFNNQYVCKLVSGEWTEISGFSKPTFSNNGAGVEFGDLTFGYGYGTSNKLLVFNFSEYAQSTYRFVADIYDWVESRGYLTSVPEGYATEDWVLSQGYVTYSALSDTVRYDKEIPIGDPDVDGSSDVLSRPLDSDTNMTTQLVLGYLYNSSNEEYDSIVVNCPEYGEVGLGRQTLSIGTDAGTGEIRIVKGEFVPYYLEYPDYKVVTDEHNSLMDMSADEIRYIPINNGEGYTKLVIGNDISGAETEWAGLVVNDDGTVGKQSFTIETDAQTQEQTLVEGDFEEFMTIPELPVSDGQYILRLSIVDGDPFYEWILDPNSQNR